MVVTPQFNNYIPNTQPPQGYSTLKYSASRMANSVVPVSSVNNTPVLQVQQQDTFNNSVTSMNRQTSIQLKEKGNKCKLEGNFEKAIEYYNKAVELNPKYTNALYNLGRTYKDVGKLNLAIETFNKLVQLDPSDFEAGTLLGEFYEEAGNTKAAVEAYSTVLKNEPNYDYAKRNLQALKVKQIALTDPKAAKEMTQQIGKENLSKALKLIQEKAPPYIVTNLQGLNIDFGLTEEVNQYENLAQYESNTNRILISNKLLFADPRVIATYIVHEVIHSMDRDSITSIKEEQDAFREMTKFWVSNYNSILDPDLTLGMNLYQQGPELLDNKVASLYSKRDPNIRLTSPNHGEPLKRASIMDSIYNVIKPMLPVQSLNNLQYDYREPGDYYAVPYIEPMRIPYPPPPLPYPPVPIPYATFNPFIVNPNQMYTRPPNGTLAPMYVPNTTNNPFLNYSSPNQYNNFRNIQQGYPVQNSYRYITLSNSDR